MMTESEAKQRWCPFVRFKSRDSGSSPAYNRDAYDDGCGAVNTDFACIGSRCMAWQWTPTDTKGLTVAEALEAAVGRCGAFSE